MLILTAETQNRIYLTADYADCADFKQKPLQGAIDNSPRFQPWVNVTQNKSPSPPLGERAGVRWF